MAGLELHFEGRVRDIEKHVLEGVLERYGFAIKTDEETGVVTAQRPFAIEKAEFRDAVVQSEADTPYYAGVAWGALKSLAQNRAHGYDWPEEHIPARFIAETYGQGRYARNLLDVTTMPATVEWAERNTAQWGVNERLTAAWQAVADAYPPEVTADY